MEINMPMTFEVTAVFKKAVEGGYICWVKELPEAISQGGTLEEAKKNLEDAFKLVLEYRQQEK
jgi:predicted RNase H-like HicB family nuclease